MATSKWQCHAHVQQEYLPKRMGYFQLPPLDRVRQAQKVIVRRSHHAPLVTIGLITQSINYLQTTAQKRQETHQGPRHMHHLYKPEV